MNFRDLHYLLAVADTGSFKRAAESCNVSQPTLSMQIKKLEEYLGVRLFERTNKKVMITEAGSRVAVIARRMLQDEKNIRDIARLAGDPRAGEFRLGAIPTLASYVFPSFVPAINAAFPLMQLLLAEEKTEILLEKLKTGRIDADLLALPVEDASLESAVLFEDEFLLAVGRDHPLAKRKSVRADELAGHKLLLLDEGHCLRDQALDVCRAHGADEEKSFRATSLETLRLMVQTPHSPLMTLMPAIAATRADDLRYIPFTHPAPSRRIGMVWRKASARAPTITEMAKLLKKTILNRASDSRLASKNAKRPHA
ncbi:MAG: LysR substrate-binding domain-containing protein [Alphaproteobacteria bacterium]|nr:LysR substrate-binding domain-containing protein [Alphaproteobacteria bacterium]